MDPPIDNADRMDEIDAAVKNGLRQLSQDDWGVDFKLLGRPSNEFIRLVARGALCRIEALEIAAEHSPRQPPWSEAF